MKKYLVFILFLILLSIIGCSKYRKIYHYINNDSISRKIIRDIDSVYTLNNNFKSYKVIFCGKCYPDTICVYTVPPYGYASISFLFNKKNELIRTEIQYYGPVDIEFFEKRIYDGSVP